MSSSKKLGSVAGSLAALLAASATAVVATSNPASAARDYASCDAGGNVNNASVGYDLTSTKHIWTVIYGKISGSGTGGESNYYTSIFEGDNRVWYWPSADTWNHNQQYTKTIPDVQTSRARYERVRMRTVFDTAGPDEECTVRWDY